MAIELKQSLKMSQQLVITPQLQQAIKMLQLSRVELESLVQEELVENPVLEEKTGDDEMPKEVAREIESDPLPDKSQDSQGEVGTKDGELKEPQDFDWENYIGSYNSHGGDEVKNFSPDDLPSYDNFISKPTTLQDHLEWQLRMCPLTDIEKELGFALIRSLDDNGYLRVSLEELSQRNNCSVEDLEEILADIQEFDPTGVGARDLQECLLLQIRLFEKKEREILEVIIKEHLNLLEKRDYPTLAKKLKLPLKKILEAAKVISELEPKPGRPFGRQETQYIVPDVYVYKIGDDYSVVLNEEGLPRLQVSNFYRNMVTPAKSEEAKEKGKEAKQYVQEKLKSALWLIKSIHQRQRTLYRVTKSIVKYQRGFFDEGISGLKPMVLKDVAEDIGVHESTVSRATTNKYVHTPQGIYELKYFFNSGLSKSTGQDVASEMVKDKIKNIIAEEDLKKPFTDQHIVEKLKALDINIARRTVAKYREMMGILPSSKRKRLY